ncbi:hypothetical protein [Streptomyces sp. NPDC006879]|uniref:hypothetical protein n=1 Tax=Streptomyces sp. NPDC006879 TaxID=3364767 RepID=UPI0036CA558B
MGSLRNPVGPLPSSIYWRRRAVLASVVALLAILAVWTVSYGGGGGSTNNDKNPRAGGPVPAITPGPSGTGPAISQQPGGREESSAGSGTGTGSGDAGGGTDSGAGKNGDPGAGAPVGRSGDPDSGTGGSAGPGSVRVPADSSLPNCTAGAVRWALRSTKNSYELGERPRFEVTATNSSSTDCKVDLGPGRAVVKITEASTDKAVWSSADCPRTASTYYQLPAGKQATHIVEWNRAFSAARCATPPPGTAAPGTYLVEATAPGLPIVQTSFVLEKD